MHLNILNDLLAFLINSLLFKMGCHLNIVCIVAQMTRTVNINNAPYDFILVNYKLIKNINIPYSMIKCKRIVLYFDSSHFRN